MIISVVIPVYNSSKSLGELYARLRDVLDSAGDDWEIIMVDDRSQDDSFQVMQNLRKLDCRVKLIRLERNSGQHGATLCGLAYSNGEYLITIDDDLQHLPEAIPRLLQEIKAGHDVVFGIPGQMQQNRYRNWGSRLIDKSINAIFPRFGGIKRSSFRALHRNLTNRMLTEPHSPIYMAALILSHAYNPGNIEVEHQIRKYGRSNYNIRKTLVMTRDLLINYSYLPIKILALLWLAFSLLGLVWLQMGRLYPDHPGAAFGTVIFSVLGSILALASLWLAAEYWLKSRRHKASRGWPYEIEEIQL